MRLAIVKDIVEWKVFLAYYESLSTEQKKQIELCTPLSVDWSVFNRSELCLERPSLLTRIIYFFIIQAWMFQRKKHSNSAFQILLYNIFVLPFVVYKNSRRNMFWFMALKLLYRRFGSVETCSDLRSRYRFERLIKHRILKEAQRVPSVYTEILSFRYYSVDVGLLVGSLRMANPNIYVTAFCRSDDTPDTKGPPTFDFNRIIFSNSFQLNRFNALSLVDKPVNFETTCFSISKNFFKKCEQRFVDCTAVLYAASDEFWNPTELDAVAQLQQMYGRRIDLTVRPMLNDSRDWEGLGCKIDSSGYQLPLNLGSLKKFYSELLAYDLIISMTSTIVGEANKMGIKSAFILDEDMEWVFDREHLKSFRERGIPCVEMSRFSDLLVSNEEG